MKPMTKTIDENTTIEEIVAHYPKLIRPLRQFGITCIACGERISPTASLVQEPASRRAGLAQALARLKGVWLLSATCYP